MKKFEKQNEIADLLLKVLTSYAKRPASAACSLRSPEITQNQNPMINTSNSPARRKSLPAKLNLIRSNIANSMIGRAVDLLIGSDKTAHGIVTGVKIDSGIPKIVVAGSSYDLGQVLTVQPPSFN